MIKRTIEFTTPEGEKKERDYYFHLTEYEALEINLMDELDSVAKSEDKGRIISALRRIVRKSVGFKIGNEFAKNDGFSDQFMASDAFSKLMMSILTSKNPERASALFIRGIMPQELIDKLADDDKIKEEIAEMEDLVVEDNADS